MTATTPPRLKSGDTIGIVAPARRPKDETVAKGVAWLESQGFRVLVHAQVSARDGTLAGDDRARAQGINDMFANPDVKAVLCACGGTGSFRTLPYIDFDVIRANPKIFCGFSDITTLLNTFYARTGLVTYHGPMLLNLGDDTHHPRTRQDFLDVLTGKAAQDGLSYPVQSLRDGVATARLVGGNISLLRNMIGTPYDWDAKDCILMIEDVGEYIYKLDHMLWQMKQAGKLDGLAGVIVGEMDELLDGPDNPTNPQPPYGRNFEDLLRIYLPDDVPICTNFPCGHGKRNTVLPIGGTVQLSVAGNTAHVKML